MDADACRKDQKEEKEEMPLTEADLALRRTGISGTESSAVVGLSQWMTPTDVWMAKKHPEINRFKATPVMQAGTRLQPIIAQWYADNVDVTLYETASFKSELYPFIVGSPDYLIQGQCKGVEIKFAMEFSRGHWGEPGTDEVPEDYLCQCYHYMLLTGYDAWDVAVLIGGWDFRIYHLLRDEEMCSMLLEAEKNFYEKYIVGNEVPPYDHGDSLRNYIRRRWPRNTPGRVIEVRPEDHDTIQRLINLRQARTELIRAKEKSESAVREVQRIMEDATALNWTFQGLSITWKNNRDSKETNWKEVALESLKRLDIKAEEKNAIVAKFTTPKPGPRVFRVSDDTED